MYVTFRGSSVVFFSSHFVYKALRLFEKNLRDFFLYTSALNIGRWSAAEEDLFTSYGYHNNSG